MENIFLLHLIAIVLNTRWKNWLPSYCNEVINVGIYFWDPCYKYSTFIVCKIRKKICMKLYVQYLIITTKIVSLFMVLYPQKVCVIISTLSFYSYTFTKSRRGYIFTAVCLSVLCVCVCVCLYVCQWTKFQLNGCTDLDMVFAERLLIALAQILLKLVTLGKSRRSRWRWRNIHFFFMIHC